MRARLLIPLGVVVAVALFCAGVVVYDAFRADRIAAGVTINGVDVGGLDAAAARVKLRRTVLEPLEQPMVVTHGSREFTLTAEKARLSLDVEGSVRKALAASRRGDPFSRTWRTLNDGTVEHEVEARVSHSRQAVRRLVRRVSRKLDRAPVDADITINASGIAIKASEEGRAVDAERLERTLHRRLVDYDGRRRIKARVSVVEPEVTRNDLAELYPAVLIVDRDDFTLTLYKNLERAKRYEIAVGKVGMDTPAGLYKIQNKAENPDWYVPDEEWAGDLAGEVVSGDDPANPIKARWMGVYDGVGVHGTDAEDSIGSAASHGCIRMRIPEVKELYDQVPVNSPIYIS